MTEVQVRRKHPLAHCEVCPLQGPENAFCPSHGPAKAKIVAVGEAPGYQEAQRGIPFVGPSGQLLNKVLEHHDISRADVFTTNACLCRPPENATPPKTAVAACRPRLVEEINAREPEHIIALGGPASQSLLGTTSGITKLRVGPGKLGSDFPGAIIIPTWHPAYCVAPHTRVLTSNLEWKAAEDLIVGEELIGFDEFPRGEQYARRMFKPSVLTSTASATLPSYEIYTSKKTYLICSADHLWLARLRKSYHTPLQWVRTEDLTPQHDLQYFVQPWAERTDREAGYVAGFLDGEGWIGNPNGGGWAQNDGPVAERVLSTLLEDNFKQTIIRSDAKCVRYNFSGPRETLRALGTYRPTRLLNNSRQLWNERQFSTENVPILSVKSVGSTPVIVLNTTTSTFIAEGFLSHNCLRKPDAFPHLVTDVGKIRNTDTREWEWVDYQVAEEPEQAIEVIKQLLSDEYPDLAIDIETGFDKDEDYDHPNNYDILCIGIGYADDGVVVIGETACNDPEVIKWLKKLFSHEVGKNWILQNGKSDSAGLWPILGYVFLTGYDTMLGSYALDERPGNHGLEYQGVEFLGCPPWKHEVKKYTSGNMNYSNIPRPELYAYNRKDVQVTWLLAKQQKAKLISKRSRFIDPVTREVKHKSLLDVHDFMVRAGNELVYLELNGMPVNLQESNKLHAQYEEKILKLETDINEVVTRTRAGKKVLQGPESDDDEFMLIAQAEGKKATWFNPRSPKQVKEFLQERGANVKDTAEDTLRLLRERVRPDSPLDEFLGLLLTHRRQAKLYGTYVKGIRKRLYRGRVYTTYLLHGTTSGRLASRNPNLQNVVRDKPIRRQFGVAKPGNILIQADYKQAEGRVICWLAQDEYLRGILSDETRDLFNELSNDLYHGSWTKEERVRTKAFFYGIGYGREPRSIGIEFKMSTAEAVERYNAFMALIPKTAAWQREVRDRVLSDRGQNLVTPFGRQRRFFLITEQNKKDVLNEALSYLPQSTASDICLSALIRLRPMLRGLAFIRLTIHDAIVAECREKDKELVGEMLTTTMAEEARKLTTYVPFPVDISYGETWGHL